MALHARKDIVEYLFELCESMDEALEDHRFMRFGRCGADEVLELCESMDEALDDHRFMRFGLFGTDDIVLELDSRLGLGRVSSTIAAYGSGQCSGMMKKLEKADMATAILGCSCGSTESKKDE